MPRFEALNSRFFNPFTCKNRELYFECILQLIEKSKEVPILYETDARNTLIIYLQNQQLAIETEDIGEEISSKRTPQENASLILRYFRSCGWIAAPEIGRTGDNIASISAYCRKLIDAISKILDQSANGTITNHIFSMYETLKNAFSKDSARAIRPYLNILVPLVEDESDLKNDLLILKDSIRDIMRMVLQMADANSFGQYLIKDALLERFFNDYFFIKRSGLIPSYIAEIERLLRRLRRSELFEKMITELMKVEQLGKTAAADKIDRQFQEVENFIAIEYEDEMNAIDRRINTYYNLYSTRMMLVLADGKNLETDLHELLLSLKEMSPDTRQTAIEELSQAHRLLSFGYIGRKSLERRRKSKENVQKKAIRQDILPKERLLELTKALLEEQPDKYSLSNVTDYLDELMRGRDEISVGEFPVQTREEAIYLAAAVIYTGTVGFPYKAILPIPGAFESARSDAGQYDPSQSAPGQYDPGRSGAGPYEPSRPDLGQPSPRRQDMVKIPKMVETEAARISPITIQRIKNAKT